MDLAYIHDLFNYNRWANGRVLDAACNLSAEQLNQELENSFRSVRETLVHILSAEWVWLERWNGNSPSGMLRPDELTDVEAIRKRWDRVESERADFLNKLTPERLTEVISYKNIRGDSFASPIWQMLVHVVNHSTYHRGQLTTLFRQVGAKPVGTDMINYYRAQ